MEIIKRRNDGPEIIASGGAFMYVLSPRPISSLNAVSDDLLHAPSLYEQGDESWTSVSSGTSLLSPAFDLNLDNFSDDSVDDYCIGSPVEIDFDRFQHGPVKSRSPDLPVIQEEEEEEEICKLDKELEGSMAERSFATDKGEDNKFQSDYNMEDRLMIDHSWTPLEPSITRWSDKDLSGHQEELSASDLARRLVEVNMQR
ncbi:hypothetical protein BPOR_0117g00090 [Botrytis porri]|uniref:Uncharacterized protein n=1 Tax=Botrytis porri TaxID=87229 RepID=A0A4Z1KXP3_9HELO|nr:hypothetical protein BPOR_0117g00090 [Botrytis porri]